MSNPSKPNETIVTPTEEEQAAIQGGANRPSPNGEGKTVNPDLLHKLIRPTWDPGGPPQQH